MKTKLDLIECINLIESVNIKLSEIFQLTYDVIFFFFTGIQEYFSEHRSSRNIFRGLVMVHMIIIKRDDK